MRGIKKTGTRQTVFKVDLLILMAVTVLSGVVHVYFEHPLVKPAMHVKEYIVSPGMMSCITSARAPQLIDIPRLGLLYLTTRYAEHIFRIAITSFEASDIASMYEHPELISFT